MKTRRDIHALLLQSPGAPRAPAAMHPCQVPGCREKFANAGLAGRHRLRCPVLKRVQNDCRTTSKGLSATMRFDSSQYPPSMLGGVPIGQAVERATPSSSAAAADSTPAPEQIHDDDDSYEEFGARVAPAAKSPSSSSCCVDRRYVPAGRRGGGSRLICSAFRPFAQGGHRRRRRRRTPPSASRRSRSIRRSWATGCSG